MGWKRVSASEYEENSMETETITSEFPKGDMVTKEQILGSEYRNKSKRPGLWESYKSRIWVFKLKIWVMLFENR